MKKSILIFSVLAIFATASYAQTETKPATTTATPTATPAAAPDPQPVVPEPNPDEHMKFKTTEHDFKTIPEGPAVSFDFEFKNIGKEPIVLSNVQASCGCTVPTWSKDPILPGKKSTITATYNTQGRPGPFTKAITVMSNVGTKVLQIKGTVEKAPAATPSPTSAPAPAPENGKSEHKH